MSKVFNVQSIPATDAILSHPSQHIEESHYQFASETPFKWRFAGGPIVAQDCTLAEIVVLKKF